MQPPSRYAGRKASPRTAQPAFGLAKRTSNLFRSRAPRVPPRIDLSGFGDVIRVDHALGLVEVEGMTTFEVAADATLAQGTMPAVVPQLKSITVGGALAGVGIEATSFRQGLVHDAVVALDVLTGDGRIVTCTVDNEHRDLFLGFANSYGTLGYALAVTMRTLPVQPYVRARPRAPCARRRGASRRLPGIARLVTPTSSTAWFSRRTTWS